jgi:hypothetical protein
MVVAVAKLSAHVDAAGTKRLKSSTMSETYTEDTRLTHAESPQVAINPVVLRRSQLPFTISLVSFVAPVVLIFAPMLTHLITGKPMNYQFDFGTADTSPLVGLLALYFPHDLPFITTIASGYIGYKLVVASGASPENPIPPNNYSLLAPLIQEGKSESIDQYVRLSSLSGFTGTFTKLGLTGLPLTTVALTLIFAALALLPVGPESQKNFFDLTKLTRGAFIGSFVQREVEQRRTPGPKGDESRTPTLSS